MSNDVDSWQQPAASIVELGFYHVIAVRLHEWKQKTITLLNSYMCQMFNIVYVMQRFQLGC